jgi:RNA polymerase II-associated factor 1
MIHQDYIARIRYSNTLPPPPNPPKLLEIPNTGLSSGQYTTPGFASRLAREQPLNIEADAELGMPLDLVGMPGVFDGDESCKFGHLYCTAQRLMLYLQLFKLHYIHLYLTHMIARS